MTSPWPLRLCIKRGGGAKNPPRNGYKECRALKSPAVWLSGDKTPDVPSFDGVLPSQFIILIVGIKRELGLQEVGEGFD